MLQAQIKYCNSLTEYSRYKTREVKIGNIPVGADNPIRIQSMTTTDTMDTIATVEQTIRMVKAGCEYVRITAPSQNEAQNLDAIKKELRLRGFDVPLIADIHFTPNAAEIAARIVEKVRVNPGNYADKKKFEFIEYTDSAYEAELERIRKRFSPLVKICKEYGTAMRIGTNHGSLSDRIMSRYGDTPLGMVESAMEFIRFCEELDYREIVLSMKASNTQVMVQAYRLLVQKMNEEGMNYPLHLGVTEAGDGEDGRIKSALGIGALLEDGLGDTIRVSLTEDPEFEAPVAITLSDKYKNRFPHKQIKQIEECPINPVVYNRRETFEVESIGAGNVPIVVSDFSKVGIKEYKGLEIVGYFYSPSTDKWNMNDTACDAIYLGSNNPPFDLPNGLKPIYDFHHWNSFEDKSKGYPLFTMEEYLVTENKSTAINFVKLSIEKADEENLILIKSDKTVVIIIETDNNHGMAEQRRLFFDFILQNVNNPVILKRDYKNIDDDKFRLYASIDLGGLLIDGFGDGVWTTAENLTISTKEKKHRFINRTLFGILQAARVRISKTEYIACPSCGRTLFDLQITTNKIRKRTEHLKGVKIAIMGCIVNGPGEMADADYGYVGSGIGKITLYRGKDIVTKSIDSEQAVDALIDLIKDDNKWVEPQ